MQSYIDTCFRKVKKSIEMPGYKPQECYHYCCAATNQNKCPVLIDQVTTSSNNQKNGEQKAQLNHCDVKTNFIFFKEKSWEHDS